MLKDYFEEKAEEVVQRMEKTPAKKLIVAILVMVSVSVLLLGFLQIKTQLERPFLAQKLIEDKAKIRGPREFLEFYKQEQRNNQELTRLQQQDSDGDGLTDYQEIYIYQTNPYNRDTDSDGIDDAAEIDQGSDPRCAKGTECDEEGFILPSGTSGSATTAAPIGEAASSDLNIQDIIANQEEGLSQLEKFSSEEREQLRAYFNSLSTQDLRQLLIQQGFPEEQVKGISDEMLRQSMEAILESL